MSKPHNQICCQGLFRRTSISEVLPQTDKVGQSKNGILSHSSRIQLMNLLRAYLQNRDAFITTKTQRYKVT